MAEGGFFGNLSGVGFLQSKINFISSNLTLTLILFTLVILIYSVFIFYFYRFLARRGIFDLNLKRYARYENKTPLIVLSVLIYILENIVLLPIIVAFWFLIFSILILILSEGLSIQAILLISAAMIASVRVTSHINESLSRDLAKMLPFTLLAVAITKPGFFNINSLILRIQEVPQIVTEIPKYLLFILITEIVTKLIDLPRTIWGEKEEKEED